MTQVLRDEWIADGVFDNIAELTAEATDMREAVNALRAERDEMEAELVMARRWVEILAGELERVHQE